MKKKSQTNPFSFRFVHIIGVLILVNFILLGLVSVFSPEKNVIQIAPLLGDSLKILAGLLGGAFIQSRGGERMAIEIEKQFIEVENYAEKIGIAISCFGGWLCLSLIYFILRMLTVDWHIKVWNWFDFSGEFAIITIIIICIIIGHASADKKRIYLKTEKELI